MEISYYRKALAYIHDTYYGDIARYAAAEILALPTLPQKAIDLGCGSGITSALLSERGISTIGVDISKDMLDIAAQKAPKARFIHSSLFDYEFEPADLICAIGEAINYLFDGKASDEAIAVLFKKIYDALSPSGYFVFDILTDEVDTAPRVNIVEKEDATIFLEVLVDTTAWTLTRKIIYFTKDQDGHYQKDAEIHRQFLFNSHRIEALLKQLGFSCQTAKQYHGLDFRKGHQAFICQKK